MTMKQHAPGTPREHAGAPIMRHDKDSRFHLTHHQIRVFNLLSDGKPRSAADISTALRLSDPRSVIRSLRHTGVQVSDYWVNTEYGRRFKRYFIRKEAGNE